MFHLFKFKILIFYYLIKIIHFFYMLRTIMVTLKVENTQISYLINIFDLIIFT